MGLLNKKLPELLIKQILDGWWFENRIIRTRCYCLLQKVRARTTGVSRASNLSYAKEVDRRLQMLIIVIKRVDTTRAQL
jgi:hypothetical protein